MPRTKPTELTATDIDALERALVAVCRRSPEDAARFEKLLRHKPWREVCESAAYSCQVTSLQLRPWHCPPMDCGDVAFANGGYGNTEKEVRPRLRMKALGLSVYEPFPAEALKEAERKRRAARRRTHTAIPEKAVHVA
jgi:hypothetical protein